MSLRYPFSPFSPSQDSETTDERAPNHGQDIYNLNALFIDILDTVKDLYSFRNPQDTNLILSRHPLDTLRTPLRYLRNTLEVLRHIHSIIQTSSLYPPYTSQTPSRHFENLLSVPNTIQTPSRQDSDTLHTIQSQLDTINQVCFQFIRVIQWTKQQKSRLGLLRPTHITQQSFI